MNDNSGDAGANWQGILGLLRAGGHSDVVVENMGTDFSMWATLALNMGQAVYQIVSSFWAFTTCFDSVILTSDYPSE